MEKLQRIKELLDQQEEIEYLEFFRPHYRKLLSRHAILIMWR
jgi:hypothetical protein